MVFDTGFITGYLSGSPLRAHQRYPVINPVSKTKCLIFYNDQTYSNLLCLTICTLSYHTAILIWHILGDYHTSPVLWIIHMTGTLCYHNTSNYHQILQIFALYMYLTHCTSILIRHTLWELFDFTSFVLMHYRNNLCLQLLKDNWSV